MAELQDLSIALAHARLILARLDGDPLIEEIRKVGTDLGDYLMMRPGRDIDTTKNLLLELGGCLGYLADTMSVEAKALVNIIAAAAIRLDDLQKVKSP
jgi:hypothetical protein